MKIVWDEPKRIANVAKHGLDFATLTDDFFDDAIIRAGKSGRLLAIGFCDRRATAVVFQVLGTQGLSVVSMRPANIRERRLMR